MQFFARTEGEGIKLFTEVRVETQGEKNASLALGTKFTFYFKAIIEVSKVKRPTEKVSPGRKK